MARFVTGNSFSTGNQVTAATLNAAVNNATISADSVDNSSVAVSGSGVLSVKTSTGASDGITFGKMQHIPANTVLVRDANDVGVVSAKAVTDTQILIGDGTGFTAAALSGDVTMTNAGAVTIANDAVETAMIADDVALGGNPTTTTQAASNNSTRIATTAYVDRAAVLANACLSRDVLVTIDTDGADLNTPVTASTWDSQTGNSAYYTFSSGVVTIVQAGSYLCGYSGTVSSNSVSAQRFDIMKGTSGSVGTTLVSGTLTTVSAGSSVTTLNVGVTGAIKLSANDTLALRAQRTGGTGNARYEDLEFFIVKLT